MPTEPRPRTKIYHTPDDHHSEMLTPWLIAAALGLAALVLFGSIERNLQNRDAVPTGPTTHHASIICPPQTSPGHPVACR
jgi:hypothetical protein